MNFRERLLTTLSHKEPDRVPIDLGGGPTGIEVDAYDHLRRLLGFESKTKTFVRDHVDVDEPIRERFGVDTRHIRVKPPKNCTFVIDKDNSYVDLWGTRWAKVPSSLYWDLVDYPIKEPTLEALKKYPWLFMGCIIEGIAIILITVPVLLPMMQSLGIDPVHVGVFLSVNVMIGPLTPPVGIAVYICSNQTGIPVVEGFRKTAPFFIPLVVTLLLITYIPDLVMFLPRPFFK